MKKYLRASGCLDTNADLFEPAIEASLATACWRPDGSRSRIGYHYKLDSLSISVTSTKSFTTVDLKDLYLKIQKDYIWLC